MGLKLKRRTTKEKKGKALHYHWVRRREGHGAERTMRTWHDRGPELKGIPEHHYRGAELEPGSNGRTQV